MSQRRPILRSCEIRLHVDKNHPYDAGKTGFYSFYFILA